PLACLAPPNRGSLNRLHVDATRVPVEEPSTASKADYALQQIGSGNSFGTSIKRCELSWTGPIERNVLARIRCPLKLEAERIDGTRHRLAPGYKLSGSGFRAGWVHELRIFSRQACRASQSLGPGLHFARDFCSPLSTVGRDLIGDPRTLRTPK